MRVVISNEFGILTWEPPESIVAYAREIEAPDEEFQALIEYLFGTPLGMMMGAMCSGLQTPIPGLMQMLARELSEGVKRALEEHHARLGGHM